MSEAYLKAVVNLDELQKKTDFRRIEPCDTLKDVIDLIWIIEWNFSPGEVFKQKLFPNPNSNIAIYSEGIYFEGPTKSLFEYEMAGSGRLIGFKFKLGGFNSFVDLNMGALTNQKIEVNEVLYHEKWAEVLKLNEISTQVACVEDILNSFEPKRNKEAKLVEEIVKYIRLNRHIVRVGLISEQFHMSSRTLQRLFNKYVGVTPKLVIRVFRLQELKEEIKSYDHLDLADLALKLEYSDQSHMINDFKAFTGVAPLMFK